MLLIPEENRVVIGLPYGRWTNVCRLWERTRPTNQPTPARLVAWITLEVRGTKRPETSIDLQSELWSVDGFETPRKYPNYTFTKTKNKLKILLKKASHHTSVTYFFVISLSIPQSPGPKLPSLGACVKQKSNPVKKKTRELFHCVPLNILRLHVQQKQLQNSRAYLSIEQYIYLVSLLLAIVNIKMRLSEY